MKWVAAKIIPEIPGLKIQIDSLDSSIKSIEITTGCQKFKLVHESYGGIRLYVPAPPIMEARWRVHGKFLGMVDVCQDFESPGDADKHLAAYNERLKHGEQSGLVVDEVEVEVTDGTD